MVGSANDHVVLNGVNFKNNGTYTDSTGDVTTFGGITFAGGGAAGSLFFTLIPAMVVITFALGLIFALWLKAKQPATYAEIGRTVLEEAHERV